MRSMKGILFALIGLVIIPAVAHAQAAIAGTVKDTSGAVLPGATVEAASAALIEKVRSAVTDGSGQYRIADLRPGTYTVTFSLTGFSTVKRDGIELTGTFTASINADLKVGSTMTMPQFLRLPQAPDRACRPARACVLLRSPASPVADLNTAVATAQFPAKLL